MEREREHAISHRRGRWLQGSPSPAPRPRAQSKEELDVMYAEIDARKARFERRMAVHERTKHIPRFVKRPPVKDYETQGAFSRNYNHARPRTAPSPTSSADSTNTGSFDAGVERSRSELFDPDIPLNVPKAWSKSKPYPSWAQNTMRESVAASAAEARTGVGSKDPPAVSEDRFQQSNADVSLRSIDHGASDRKRTSKWRSPSPQKNHEYRGRSPERSRIWDADVDFTARSFQLEMSPMLRIKPVSRLEEIREREIQDLSARAVATDRLEEIKGRNSEERSLKEETPVPESVKEPKEEIYCERTILEEEGYPIPGTPITVFPNNSYPHRSNSNHKREDSYDTLRKLSRLLSQSPGPSRRRGEEHEEHEGDEGDEEKEDEYAEEKRLIDTGAVRVSEKTAMAVEISEKSAESSRPNPEKQAGEKQAEKEAEAPLEKQSGRLQERINGLSHNYSRRRWSRIGAGFPVDSPRKRGSTASTPPKSDADPEERISAEPKLSELQENPSEKNLITVPSRSTFRFDGGHLDETPRPKAGPLSLPTPRVTGAFIETPAPSRNTESQQSTSPSHELCDPVALTTSASENQQSPENSGDCTALQQVEKPKLRAPDIPHPSANVPQHARTQSLTRGVSLHREVTERELGRFSRPPLVNTAKVSTAAEDLRRLEIEAGIEDSTLDNFETLYKHDTAHEESIRRNSNSDPLLVPLHIDPKILLSAEERERQIELLIWARMEQQLRNTSTSIRDAKHGIERLEQQVSAVHDLPGTVLPSKPSDGSSHHIKIQIDMKLPRLWTNKPVAVADSPPQVRGRFASFGPSRNWKFTWLGFILVIFFAWFTAEWTMCEIYCHPLASTKNTWQPTDPFFPWAIPTKLDQWTGEIASSALYGVKERLDNWRDPEGLRYKRLHYHPYGGGANDWWLGRGAPMEVFKSDKRDSSIFNDDYD
ncbi:hypothetical protein LZ554_005015 [Drepanopeziza brunnea f. sp. 'monogermtubi']|nr:hypothetical protein LZ554_005015 [Drepanopeziza brunnea f. sp. 'monogermtubi']